MTPSWLIEHLFATGQTVSATEAITETLPADKQGIAPALISLPNEHAVPVRDGIGTALGAWNSPSRAHQDVVAIR